MTKTRRKLLKINPVKRKHTFEIIILVYFDNYLVGASLFRFRFLEQLDDE